MVPCPSTYLASPELAGPGEGKKGTWNENKFSQAKFYLSDDKALLFSFLFFFFFFSVSRGCIRMKTGLSPCPFILQATLSASYVPCTGLDQGN